MAEFDYKKIVEVRKVPIAAASVFTNSNSRKTFARLIHIHNPSDEDEIVKIYFVPNAGGALGVASDDNEMIKKTVKAGGDSLIEYAVPGYSLEADFDSIQMSSERGDSNVFIMGGDE